MSFLFLTISAPATASEIRTERVDFKKGSSSAVVEESIKGDATGDIPCGMGGGQPTGACPFGVVLEGNGCGVVTVTKPDGRTRSIFFENGEAVRYDASQADPGEFSARREGDLNIIRIGDEHYRIPDAVIFGG